jgi:hypothetical protein
MICCLGGTTFVAVWGAKHLANARIRAGWCEKLQSGVTAD